MNAICFSSSMHSVLPVDKSGNPLGNAIVWADNRGAKEAELLKKLPQNQSIYHATRTPIYPISPLIKITWLKNHDAERFAQTYKFISVKEFVLKQLTGEYAIDHSITSSTGLFDIHKLKWYQESFDYAGISADRLSKPVSVFNDDLVFEKRIWCNLGFITENQINYWFE